MDKPVKRLFIAMEVTGKASNFLYNIQREIKDIAGEGISSVCKNITDVERKFHITLKFFGDTPVNEIDGIGKILDNLQNSGELIFQVSNLGFFGKLNKPGAIFAGITGDVDKLHKIMNILDKNFGFEEHSRFKPHITIGRRKNIQIEKINEIKEYLKKGITGPVFSVKRIVLFSSKLNSAGPVYTEERFVSLVEKNDQ